LPTEIRHKTPPAVRTLMTELIDYAGLFPPAALSLEMAVHNYARYLESEHCWMLGRFILPASRLPELSETLRSLAVRRSSSQALWKISALVGENFDSDIASIVRFNSENRDAAVVDAIETKPELRGRIAEVIAVAPVAMQIFAECPLQSSVDFLTALQRSGARAKIRTGGLVPGAIPSTRDLATFLINAAKAGIAFKATAGLHHPLRCLKPLTYDSNAPSAEMHGFLNLLVACALALSGASIEVLCEVLADQNPASFEFSDTEVRWKQHSFSNLQLQDVRERSLLSFGSCSFAEPVNELASMGWL
jgi:hypothetical protein